MDAWHSLADGVNGEEAVRQTDGTISSVWATPVPH